MTSRVVLCSGGSISLDRSVSAVLTCAHTANAPHVENNQGLTICGFPSRTGGGISNLLRVRRETSIGAGLGGGDDRSPANLPGEDTAPSARQVLRFLAAALRARAAVEIGTSTDRACATVRGMTADGVLTSIDVDPETQRAARAALVEADLPMNRMRLITGCAREVLPRLTEGGYDLVTVCAATVDPTSYLDLGLRLLRSGGVIVFDGVRTDEARAAPTRAARELVRAVRARDHLVPLALPVGLGMFAVARAEDGAVSAGG